MRHIKGKIVDSAYLSLGNAALSKKHSDRETKGRDWRIRGEGLEREGFIVT
jgi:hypothetical protein